VLADGMGGHPEGEVAAQLALQTISALYQKQANPKSTDVPAFLSSAVMAAHHQIIRTPAKRACSTRPAPPWWRRWCRARLRHWVHCGDSRLYLVRDGKLLTRTRDHSYMEQPPPCDRAWSGINRNILFTCLGRPPSRCST
jgi:serine/threonine protein phosphatase PrpC